MATVMLNKGLDYLTRCWYSGQTIRAISFKVGNVPGLVPNYNAEDLDPSSVVYEGGISNIISTMLPTRGRYSIVIPYIEGPYSVGSVMLFAESEGKTIPLVHDIYDEAIPKEAGIPFVLNLTLNLEVVQADPSTVENAHPQLFQTERVPSNVCSWSSFIVQDDPLIKRPALVINHENSWRVNWLWQRLNDPYYGSFYGGVVGDGFTEN